MNDSKASGTTLAAAVAMLAIVGGGGWYGWDQGYIGHNPRAPTPEAVQAAVRSEAARTLAQRAAVRCQAARLSLPDELGVPGIVPRNVPGQQAYTYVARPGREAQIALLDHVASHGLLAASDVQRDGGPARNYRLTWAGYLHLGLGQDPGAPSICLRGGRRELGAISTIRRTGEKVRGLPIYEVAAMTKVAQLPPWLQGPVARRVVPMLAQSTGEGVELVRIVRTREGWRPLGEFQGAGAQPVPSREQAAAALARAAGDPGRSAVACLPLHLRRGDDPAAEQGMPFRFTLTDRADRPADQLRMLLPTLEAMAALESAGLAEREVLRPTARPLAPDAAAGLRYTLQPEAATALGVTSEGGGCLPAGTATPALLDLWPESEPVRVLARGELQQVPDWVRTVATQLPALQSLLTEGLAYQGKLTRDGQAWRVQSLAAFYPEAAPAAVPAHLALFLPRTTGAKADGGAEATPAISPLHVVGVEEGALRADAPRTPSGRREGTVDVHVSVPGAVLLLVSRDPVEWRVHASVPVKQVLAIGEHERRVTYIGPGTPAMVTQGVPELVRRGQMGMPTFDAGGQRNQLAEVRAFVENVMGRAPDSFQGASARNTSRFEISAATPAFGLPAAQAPQGNRGPIVLRAGLSAEVAGTTVLRGPAGAYSDAMTEQAFSAGKGYFEATMRVTGSATAHPHANVGLCEGRSRPDPMAAALALGSGGRTTWGNGTVFGFAADFDRQRLYVRVDGRWLRGEPGGGGGIALEKDHEYRACAFAAGTSSEDVKKGQPRSDTTWDFNFGGKPFQAPPPAGFAPLQAKN